MNNLIPRRGKSLFTEQRQRRKHNSTNKVRIWLCASSFVYYISCKDRTKLRSGSFYLKRMSTLKFRTSHATRCILMRKKKTLELLGLLLSLSGCCLFAKSRALPALVCFLPLPFKIITLMWTQNYILPSLNMAVISDSCCYWIRVWVRAGWRDWGWVEIREPGSWLQHSEMWYAMAVHGYWVQDRSDNSVEKVKSN